MKTILNFSLTAWIIIFAELLLPARLTPFQKRRWSNGGINLVVARNSFIPVSDFLRTEKSSFFCAFLVPVQTLSIKNANMFI